MHVCSLVKYDCIPELSRFNWNEAENLSQPQYKKKRKTIDQITIFCNVQLIF